MKSLLSAIQAALRNDAGLTYVRDEDIFISTDENIIPRMAAFPAVGIKDGPVSEGLEAAKGSQYAWDVRYRVHVVAYVDMKAGEIPVMGQTEPETIKGIMDVREDVHAVLHENYLSRQGCMDARCVEEGESEVMAGEDVMLLKKRMTYEYRCLEVR